MDLINSIFDDKRIKRHKVQGKTQKNHQNPSAKPRNTVKSASDKSDSRHRCVSQNDRTNHGSDKRDIKINGEIVQIEKSKKKEEEKSEEEKPINSEKSTVSPDVIRNFSKYFQENDSIEDSFESALELYNDCTFDDKDAYFGRESFQSLDKDFFVEAYNKEGYELLETSIQLSFNTVDYTVIETPEEDNELIFKSDDDSDDSFPETYNSVGYELKKIHLRNKEEETKKDKSPKSSSNVGRSCSNASNTSNLTRIDSTSSAGSYCLSTGIEHRYYPEKVLIKELQRLDSVEEPNIENKSIEELARRIAETTLLLGDTSIKRSSSLTSKKSNLSRYNSASSVGSIIFNNSESKYDDFLDSDDDVPNLKITFDLKTKADMVIQELLESEQKYIENLTIIKRDYMRYFKRLRLDTKGMFGNIHAILKETKNFYYSLHACGNDYEYIGNTFKDYKHLFELYPEYSKNKVSADVVIHGRFKPILQERQRTLKDKLGLSSYLLNPVQRLGRYILLLKTLQKNVRKSESLEGAIKLLEQCMKRGNDYVAIESILECDIDLYNKGSYIDREKFILLKPRREEIVLFLFEQIVIFTYQKPNTEKFVYKSSICLDDLQIINPEGEDHVFQLKNYTKSKRENQEQHTYILEARSVRLKETWVQLIQNKLWEQLQQVKARSKTYKLPDLPEGKPVKSPMTASNSVKEKSTTKMQKRNRTASDRNSTKRNSKFYQQLEETSGYDTL